MSGPPGLPRCPSSGQWWPAGQGDGGGHGASIMIDWEALQAGPLESVKGLWKGSGQVEDLLSSALVGRSPLITIPSPTEIWRH